MIIFGTSREFIESIQVMAPYSHAVLESLGVENINLFNLTGYSMYTNLDLLVPPMSILRTVTSDERTFDYNYAEHIFKNDNVFKQFMQIIFPIYSSGGSTASYICISHSDMRDTIAESLMKLIQQRYGINATIISDDPTDILSMTKGDFSVAGLYVMDEDYKRYLHLGGIPLQKEDYYV